MVLQWDEELLQAVRALPPGPTVTARAISVVHTAIFDAWAAYDPIARGTRLGTQLRRPAAERTLANKNKAISFAAYKALVDLFPARQFDFAEQMSYLGYAVDGSDASTPATVGNTAGQAVPTTATPMGPISSTAMPTPPATSRSTPATRSSTPGAGSRCGCRSAAASGSGPPPPSGKTSKGSPSSPRGSSPCPVPTGS